MARVRDVPPTLSGGPSDGALALLLHARRFRIGPGAGTEEIAQNLERFGGELRGDAPVWIGSGRAPANVPSIALGESAGTLGPASLGFINATDGVAAWNGPLAALPLRGRVGVIVGAADELPDVPALLARYGVGASWLISTGTGDPAAVLRFLNHDRATDAILFFGMHADSQSLRPLVGVKPTAVLGGDRLLAALVRAAGGVVATGLEEWLATAQLLPLRSPPDRAPRIVVRGAGIGWVRSVAAARNLSWPIEPWTSNEALVRAPADGPTLLCATGASVLADTGAAAIDELVRCDLATPHQLHDLLDVLARRVVVDPLPPSVTIDHALRDRVRNEVEGSLTDHDAKRLLKAYGVRVTRQAPTNTPTGATKLAKQLGIPVVVERNGDQRVAETLPDLRRITSLLLELPPSERDQQLGLSPSVMLRERLPETPRTRVKVHHDRELGPLMRIGDELALLPLAMPEARRLATATQARRAADQVAVAAMLYTIAACAVAERATFELELFVGAEPVVVSVAVASLPRAPSAPGPDEPEDES